jgi:hypothetical protein
MKTDKKNLWAAATMTACEFSVCVVKKRLRPFCLCGAAEVHEFL